MKSYAYCVAVTAQAKIGLHWYEVSAAPAVTVNKDDHASSGLGEGELGSGLWCQLSECEKWEFFKLLA